MFYIAIFFQYVAQYMKTRMQYRADLFVEIFSDLLFQAVNLIFILVVFGHTNFLGGWTRMKSSLFTVFSLCHMRCFHRSLIFGILMRDI